MIAFFLQRQIRSGPQGPIILHMTKLTDSLRHLMYCLFNK